jgi:hypothetical protein
MNFSDFMAPTERKRKFNQHQLSRRHRIERFWSHVDIKGKDDCWNWQGSTRSGYGVFQLGRGLGVVTSHVFAFLSEHKSKSNSTYVCHSCDNPSCCNPNHLFEGTPLQNNTDCGIKMRRNGRGKSISEQQENLINYLISMQRTKPGITKYLSLPIHLVNEVRYRYLRQFRFLRVLIALNGEVPIRLVGIKDMMIALKRFQSIKECGISITPPIGEKEWALSFSESIQS